MIDLKILHRAALIGIGFELALVVGATVWPPSRPGLLFACMLTAAVAGMIYGRDLARGFGSGMLGGTLVGAACGVVAVTLGIFSASAPKPTFPMACWCSCSPARWAASSASWMRGCAPTSCAS